MSVHKVNQVESLNTATTDLVLKGKDIDLQGGVIKQNGVPFSPGGGGAGGGISLIFDPTAITETALVKNIWANIMTAIGTAPGLVDLYIHKPGLFLTQAIPAGTYDLSKVRLGATVASIATIISFDAGTTLTGFPFSLSGVTLETKNTVAPLYTNPSFFITNLIHASIRTANTATQPVIYNGSGKSATIIIDSDLSPIYKNGGSQEPIFNEGSLSLNVLHVPDNSFYTQTNLFTNASSGTGTIGITSYEMLPGGYTGTHVNYNGTLNIFNKNELRVEELINNVAQPCAVFTNVLSPGGNIFDTMGDLQNFIFLHSSKIVTVYFLLSGSVIVPANIYNFQNAVFKKMAASNPVSVVEFTAETTFTFWPIDCEIDLKFNNIVSPVTNLIAASRKASFSETANLINNGTQPIFQTNSGGDTVDLIFKDQATMTPTAGVIAKTNTAGAPINITLFDYAILPTGSLESAVGGSINIKNYTLVNNGTITSVVGDSGGLVVTNEYENRVNQLIAAFGISGATYVPTITATVSNPTKATTPTEDVAFYDARFKKVKVVYTYHDLFTGGATAGSGTYLFSLPLGYTIDTAKLPSRAVVGKCRVFDGANPSQGNVVFDASVSTTHVFLETIGDGVPFNIIGSSGNYPLNNNPEIEYRLDFEVPVV